MSMEKLPPDFAKPSSNLFLVHKTSNSSAKPCDEAFEVSIPQVNYRLADCELPPRWYDQGENHRLENGLLKRDAGYLRLWAINILSLDDLVNFCRRNGKCVVSIDEEGYQRIEIYDDYRE